MNRLRLLAFTQIWHLMCQKKPTRDKFQIGENIDLAILLTDNLKRNRQMVGLEEGQFIVQPENNYKKTVDKCIYKVYKYLYQG